MKRKIVALVELSNDRQCLIKRCTGTDDMQDMPILEVSFHKDYEVVVFECKLSLPYDSEENRDLSFDKLVADTKENLEEMYNQALQSSGMAELVKELEEVSESAQ